MKRFTACTSLLIALVLPVLSAHAVPNCFTRPNVAEGEFLIYIDTNKISKDDLIEVQTRANGQYISVESYPFMLGNSMIISVKAIDYSYDNQRLTRKDLRKAAKEELNRIDEIEAVSVSCNGLKSLSGR